MINTGRDTYMTIWKMYERDGKFSAQVSTSHKDTRTNEWVNSYWFIRFVKDAAEKAKTLVEKDRILVKAGDLNIENIYKKDGEEKKSSLILTAFNFEKQEKKSASTKATSDDELPF